jgi:tellurite resistance protein TehA-like permease
MTLATAILTIYIWVVVCTLLFFLYVIARFFEKKSGRRSYYPSFFLPIVLFAIAAVRYLFLVPAIAGDLWGDLLRFVGGILVGGLGLLLLRLMMGGRS